MTRAADADLDRIEPNPNETTMDELEIGQERLVDSLLADVSKTPEKKRIRRGLINAALATLEREGWKVARVKGGGKGRVRRITKNGKSQLAVVRTTQDTWIAFPRNED